MTRHIITLIAATTLCAACATAKRTEAIAYGDFERWVTRNIKESAIIGGGTKTIYEVGPTMTINDNRAYVNAGGSPWATSNVYAKVVGISKASCAVYPFERAPGNMCAKLCTQLESVKAVGIIRMDVLVAGSMFLGRMFEPIAGTSDPMQKMEMGVPFTGRPSALMLDYRLDVPASTTRTRSTGFSPRKTLPGRDSAVVFIFLQKRWEDSEGNLHACRVGTGAMLFSEATDWRNDISIPIVYGNCSRHKDLAQYGLRNGDNAYCARNSKGKVVAINEESWGTGNEQPTHVIVMISASKGEPYIGTLGLTFYVDNVRFSY